MYGFNVLACWSSLILSVIVTSLGGAPPLKLVGRAKPRPQKLSLHNKLFTHKFSTLIHNNPYYRMSPYSSSSVVTGTTSDESSPSASRRTSDSDNYEEYNNNEDEESPSVETSQHSSRSGTTNISSGYGAGSNDEQQLFFITSYSNFDKLAHGPRGHIAKHTLRTYKFSDDGSLVLLHIAGDGESVLNPAFSRFHPR